MAVQKVSALEYIGLSYVCYNVIGYTVTYTFNITDKPMTTYIALLKGC